MEWRVMWADEPTEVVGPDGRRRWVWSCPGCGRAVSTSRHPMEIEELTPGAPDDILVRVCGCAREEDLGV